MIPEFKQILVKNFEECKAAAEKFQNHPQNKQYDFVLDNDFKYFVENNKFIEFPAFFSMSAKKGWYQDPDDITFTIQDENELLKIIRRKQLEINELSALAGLLESKKEKCIIQQIKIIN